MTRENPRALSPSKYPDIDVLLWISPRVTMQSSEAQEIQVLIRLNVIPTKTISLTSSVSPILEGCS